MKRFVVVALSLFLFAAATGSAQGQSTPAPQDADVAAALLRINQTLSEIKDLLARQAESQTLDLALRRAAIASTRAADLSRQLREVELDRRSVEEQKARVEENLKMIEAQVESGVMDLDPKMADSLADQTAGQIKRLEARGKDLDLEIVGLRNQVDQARADVRNWQSLLDRRLAVTPN